jgi:hypothetical protein
MIAASTARLRALGNQSGEFGAVEMRMAIYLKFDGKREDRPRDGGCRPLGAGHT